MLLAATVNFTSNMRERDRVCS